MTITPSPYEILPPEKGPADRPGSRGVGNEGEWFARKEPTTERRAGFARILPLLVAAGAAAVVGWQTSYGHTARETIAGMSPSLRWVEPEETTYDRIDQIAHDRIDQIAQDRIDQIAHDRIDQIAHDRIDQIAHERIDQIAHDRINQIAHDRINQIAQDRIDQIAHDKIDRITHDKIDQITRNIEQIASDRTASREQLTRRIDQLAAGQEQMSREISRLRTSGQSTWEGPHRSRHYYHPYYRW
jgi:hypothetical protein